MFALARIPPPAPVSILLPSWRSRVGSGATPGTVPRTLAGFDACFRVNPFTRAPPRESPASPPRVPRELPNWRAKAALHSMGLLATVDAAIAAMPSPQGDIVRLAWAGDAMLARDSATVAALAAGLGLDSAALDAFFIAAAGIDV